MQFKFQVRLFLLLASLISLGQELPPIIKYTQSNYQAGIQNWMISEDSNRFIFFANNEGLLEYNGSTWTLYPSPNESIIRSVKCINDKIYTGSYMDFGYWERKSNGQLHYTSLSESIKDKIQDDEQFWGIFSYDNWILFQSLEHIYAYNLKTKDFSIIAPESNIFKAYKTSNGIYYQTNEGLFEIEQGKSKLFIDNDIIRKNKIINLNETNDGLLLITQKNGIFKYKNSVLSKLNTSIDKELLNSSVYCSQYLSDGSLVLGTVSNGIFVLDNSKKLLYHVTQTDGLNNNTALSLFEDFDKNLWIGLDNGINCINLQSPIKSFSDNSGILGTIYTSVTFQNILYIGTNQGLFYKNMESASDFQLVKGTKGQVWSLFIHDDFLFCGHDSGTFIINNTSANLIYNQYGTWKFESVTNNKNIVLQGNYVGISVLEKINGSWTFKNKIKGFDYSAKHFELLNLNEIYVSHEYKGIYRFQIDALYKNANNIVKYKEPSKGKNASLIKYKNQIYYAYKGGVFKLDPISKKFIKDKFLSSIFDNNEYVTGKMIVDKSDKLWFFTKSYMHSFASGKLSKELKKSSLSIPAALTNSMPGYENISLIADETYLIGTTDGYYVLKNNQIKFNNYKVSITQISNSILNKTPINVPIFDSGVFNYKANNIVFNYTVPEYDKYINAEYQYKLEGIQDWSDWSSKSSISFKNLQSGDYVFSVRAKVSNSVTENIATYSFTINQPWYSNGWALLFYIITFFIIIFYVNQFYTNYHDKRHQKIIAENNLLLELKELEREQDIMKFKNEQLSQDVDKKNKELAVSTMNLIKKTELLNIIKEDLKSSTDDGSNRSIKSIISTITRNVKEEDTWNVFKEAFDNVDNDFIKNLKQLHPSLTPNDLRLCAYLRLNLSSKEIAPLINISVRSVEIKRYRLRKKMDLMHEQGLVEYILSI